MNIKVLANVNYHNQDELFQSVYQKLLSAKMVKETFLEAIKNREQSFPTGLKGSKRNIAIPHTDPRNIKQSGYMIVMNQSFIEFKNMANQTEILKTKLIIFILSHTNQGHMNLLQQTLNLANIKKLPDPQKLKGYLERSLEEWKKF